MNEKDLNRAILAQLYAKAQKLWAESMEFFQFSGSFTARQLAGALYVYDNYIQAEKELHALETAKVKDAAAIKKAKKVLAKWEGAKEFCPIMDREKKDEIITVSLDTFECEFPARLIWKYIYHFERLAGVGGDVMRFVVPERSEVMDTYEVTITKDMAGLAQYCARNDYRQILECVALDIDGGRAVATDGRKLCIKPLQVVSMSAAVGECVVIPAKDWQTVCRAAGKGATLTIHKVQQRGETSYRYMLGDIVGRNYPGRYVSYTRVLLKINEGARVRLSAKDWTAEKKAIKACKKNAGARLVIMQRAGMLEIMIKDETTLETLHKATFKPEKAAAFDFAVKYIASSFPSLGNFDVFIPCASALPLLAVDGADVVLNMPAALCAEDYKEIPLYDYKGQEGDINILTDLRQNTKHNKDMGKVSEKTGAAVVNVRPVEEKATKAVPAATEVAAKEVRPAAPKKAAAAPKAAAPKAKKTAAKVGGFDFAAVGIKPGDSLQFIGGEVVTVADGGKVEYNGELYTLTGFCKHFMPEARRCKSGAYRGPVYFTFGGVRLDKLAKGATACAQTAPEATHKVTARKAAVRPAGTRKKANKAITAVIDNAAPVTAVQEVAPAVQAATFPAASVNDLVPVVSPGVPVARPSIIGRLRRWAVAAVLLVLVAVGLAAWMQRGTIQDTPPVGVHQPATPAPTAAPVTALNATNGASTTVIGAPENHRNGGGYPFEATDLGARSAALIPASSQATNKANNE